MLLRSKMRRLPPVHQATVKAIVEHLARVVSHSEKNKMDPKNLAIVFGGVIFGEDEMPKGGDLLSVQTYKVLGFTSPDPASNALFPGFPDGGSHHTFGNPFRRSSRAPFPSSSSNTCRRAGTSLCIRLQDYQSHVPCTTDYINCTILSSGLYPPPSSSSRQQHTSVIEGKSSDANCQGAHGTALAIAPQ